MLHALSKNHTRFGSVQRRYLLAAWWLLPVALEASAAAAEGREPPTSWSASASVDARSSLSVPRAYRVINLVSGSANGTSGFNDRDQIALSVYGRDAAGNPLPEHTYFYDGKSLRDIGSFGGSSSKVTGINHAGELTGTISTVGNASVHAFKWTARDGLRDLGSRTANFLDASHAGLSQPINQRGQVVGYGWGPVRDQAVLWTPGEAVLLLDGLPGNQYGFSVANAINNTGVIGGQGAVADGTTQAFTWTRESGYVDVSPAGAVLSGVLGLTDDGLILGNARDASDKLFAFSWTRKAGPRRLATGGFEESSLLTYPLLSRGNVAGFVRSGDVAHAAVWPGGAVDSLIDLGTFGGPMSYATAVNQHAQVVGVADYAYDNRTSFVWTRRDGKVDLNLRLSHAPPGLFVYLPYAISDRGTIFAETNAGFVLLKPEENCAGLDTVTVDAIEAVDIVAVGTMFDMSLGFAGPTVGSAVNAATGSAGRNDVLWSFGDGRPDQRGNTRESHGAGQAGVSHRYTSPGIYTVSAQVNGGSGAGPKVSRTIVAYDRASGSSAGNGWFTSPVGANRTDSPQAGRGYFTFAASGVDGKQAVMYFRAGTLNFRSNAVTAVRSGGGETSLEGTGKLNGAGNYRFSFRASGSETGNENGTKPASSRIGLKIWHTDQATNAEVIDYDNLGTGVGSVVSAEQGKIVSQ